MTSQTGHKSDDARSRAGFTLIELVLVMAMLLIVLAVAFPSLSNFFRGRNLDSEARRFLSLTRYGQSRAVSEGVPMVLWLDTQQRAYGLQAAPGYLDVDGKAVEFTLDEGLQVEISTPAVAVRSSQWNQTAAISGNMPAIVFSPDGFIGETSPDYILIREGRGNAASAIGIVQSANRLNYEIQPNYSPNARR